MLRRSPLKVIFESLIGLFFMLLFYVLMNLLEGPIDHHNFTAFVDFFNKYLYIGLISSFITFIAKINACFKFPMNILAPFIFAVDSILMVFVGIKFWVLVASLYSIGWLEKITGSDWIGILYPLLFTIVLVFNLVEIVAKGGEWPKEFCENEKSKKGEKSKKEWEKKECDKKEWDNFQKSFMAGVEAFKKSWYEKNPGKDQGKKEKAPKKD